MRSDPKLVKWSRETTRQAEHPPPNVLDADLHAAAAAFGALAHPVRLEILRRLVLGARTLAELAQIPGLGTSGQLHHHLRELRSAGLIAHRRNHYTAAPDRFVAWLVMIAAAIGPAALVDLGPTRPPDQPQDRQE